MNIVSNNPDLLTAASDLLAAARKFEEADAFHINCEKCEGEELPETCGHCFPLYDDARVMRRNAIAKAESAISSHQRAGEKS